MMSNNQHENETPSSEVQLEQTVEAASDKFVAFDDKLEKSYKKNNNLKDMLESNKDSLKLEAMKRLIGLIAKGRDASEFFPTVVKNVVSKNMEIKKLVYVYLVRYAETHQDLILLSISTFQRSLKEPNQLFRASALKVLSSIRVKMIVPIILLALKDAVVDMSAYVRKTAAYAVVKLHKLDSSQKYELVSIIDRLLADRTTLVVGSAVMAFEEVCPERLDLIHKVYRKLCSFIGDIDEWNQVITIQMLTRYARTQFSDPNLRNMRIRSKSCDTVESDAENKSPAINTDHKLLLKSVRPLLQSRNAAVVMAVTQLYHHAAPMAEFPIAAKALVRLLRSHPEVQNIVLDSICSIIKGRKSMFEQYLKTFFVRKSDLTRIKLLKLDILTHLATDNNITLILQELRTYLFSNDKQFVAATIQALGLCAFLITEVSESCLNCLVALLSNKDENIVAESVVVIKNILQIRTTPSHAIVNRMTKILDNISIPEARATILWLVGEYCDGVMPLAPDVLRKIAKNFCDEHNLVKLQALNLSIKLSTTNNEKNKLLCQYIFNLSRYDQNYDIRDRTRFLRYFIQSNENDEKSFFRNYTKDIFLVKKPKPMFESKFRDRHDLQLGTLSHYINTCAKGYLPLPPWPMNPPPGNTRQIDLVVRVDSASLKKSEKNNTPLKCGDRSSESSVSECPSTSASELEDESYDGISSDYKNISNSDEINETENLTPSDNTEDSPSKATNDSISLCESHVTKNVISQIIEIDIDNQYFEEINDADIISQSSSTTRCDFDLLLDLNQEISNILPVMTPSRSGFAHQNQSCTLLHDNRIESIPPSYVSKKSISLLDRIIGNGLSVTYKYTRNPHLFSTYMVNIGLTFKNNSRHDITDIKVGNKTLPTGMAVHDFSGISVLSSDCCLPGILGIDFNDSTNPANFEIVSSVGIFLVNIKPLVGELIRPMTLSEDAFIVEQSKLRGMNEYVITILTKTIKNIDEIIFQFANVYKIPSSIMNSHRFAGETLKYASVILICIDIEEQSVKLKVNSENPVIGSLLLNELKNIF